MKLAILDDNRFGVLGYGQIRDGDILDARIGRIGRLRMAVTRLGSGPAAGTANGEASR